MIKSHILVLGVGNFLLKDEGFGIHVINQLSNAYSFSDNVKLLDGGTLGMKLLPDIAQADHLIVIDIISDGNPPGTICRFSAEELQARLSLKNSLHQVTFTETIAMAQMEGYLPETAVIAVECQDMTPWGTTLTPPVQLKVEPVIQQVLEEISRAGGTFRKSEKPADSAHIQHTILTA
jgi:hydrogenase maturation protease